MKETTFIRNNKEKWAELEAELSHGNVNPEKITRHFVQITDDLSFSRTFYYHRRVRVYLNGLAQKMFSGLFGQNPLRWKNFVAFWKEDLPCYLFEARKDLLLSFILFMVCVGIGFLSSSQDPDFVNTILGESYVKMTEENIANNDPMAVYKQDNEMSMFLSITFNNIRVAFLSFVGGLLFGLGTLVVNISNGVMVGAFVHLFVRNGMFWEAFPTIMQHGTMELSAIVISNAAGFTLARGLIMPGTYSRGQSLRLAAMRGLKILMALVPVLIFAGFVEGFLTRHTELDMIWKWAFMVASLIFVLACFVWYPARKGSGGAGRVGQEESLVYRKPLPFRFGTIYSGNALFGYALSVLGRYFGRLFLPLLGISLFLGGLLTIMKIWLGETLFSSWGIWGVASELNGLERFFFFFPLCFVIMLISLFQIHRLGVEVDQNPKKSFRVFFKKQWPSIVLAQVILLCGFLINFPLGVCLMLFFWCPVLTLLMQGIEKGHFFLSSLEEVRPVFKQGISGWMGFAIKWGLLGFLLLLLIQSPIWGFVTQAIFWIFNLTSVEWGNLLFRNTAIFFVFALPMTLLSISVGLQFFSLQEVVTAKNLRERIQMMGKRSYFNGFSRN